MPQQAKAESPAFGRKLMVLRLSEQKGIACKTADIRIQSIFCDYVMMLIGREAATMVSDETAYRRYLDGEEKAADLLVERYGDALTLYINSYIRDIHEAEDLMIEAFSRIFVKERPISGEGSFKTYHKTKEGIWDEESTVRQGDRRIQ